MLICVCGSLQSLQQVLGQGKTLNKAVYVLSVDEDTGKVAHGCFVPPQNVDGGFDAKTWANAVAEVVGGKVRWFSYVLRLDARG